MVKTYTTRSTEKKLLGHAMKYRKSVTTKRRILKRGAVVDEEHIEVVDVGEEERDIDADVVSLT